MSFPTSECTCPSPPCTVVSPEIVNHLLSKAGFRVVKASTVPDASEGGRVNTYYARDYLVLVEKLGGPEPEDAAIGPESL